MKKLPEFYFNTNPIFPVEQSERHFPVKISLSYFRMLLFTFSFLFTVLMTMGHSQLAAFKFDHFSLKQGLSQTNIYAMAQDSSGFLWFGTQDGLNKFDGYRFSVYHHISGDSTSLPDDWITALEADSSGNVWIGSVSGGVSRFDTRCQKFTNFKSILDKNVQANRAINDLMIDSQGYLWIATNGNGIFRYNIENDIFLEYEFPGKITTPEINVIQEDSDGNIWIGTQEEGVYIYNIEQQKFQNFSDFTEYSFMLNNISSILTENQSHIWLGTQENGLLRYDPATKTFDHYTYFSNNPNTISSNMITQLYQDPNGWVWAGTAGGLNLYLPESNEFLRILENPRDQLSLKGKQILSIFEDRSGVLWVGTEEGINKYDKRQNVFTHIKHDPLDKNSLCNNNIWSICEDRQGYLWFGTDDGVSRFSSRENQFITYQPNKESRNSLSHSVVRTIIEDEMGNIWIGTDGGGVNKLDRNRRDFTRYIHDADNNNTISSNTIRALHQDQFGTLWIGTWNGLDEFFPHSNKINHYRNEPGNPLSLSDNRVRTIYEDRNGNFWVGTYGGLNLYDRDSKQFTAFSHDDSNPLSLSIDRIICIYEDTNGQLWIGTFKGLNKLIVKNGAKISTESVSFQHYTTKDGLPNNVIYGILEDEQGYLWVSTNKGLARFNPAAEEITFRNYNVDDGLQSNEFNGGAALKLKNGELIFGGIKGISKFDPENIIENTYIPPIVLTAFQIYNKTVLFEKSVNTISQITLSHRDDFFSIEFAALDFTNPEKNQYAYKLEGYNDDWIQSGNRHSASYTNLGGGEYVFQVKGSNSGGRWNETPKSLKIIIVPPFYATWTFRIFVVIILVISGFSVYRIKIRNIARQREMLRQQVNEQTAKMKKRNRALKKAEKDAQQFAAQASLLTEVGQRVSSVLDIDSLLNEIVISAQEAFDYYGVMLFMKDHETSNFRLQSIAGGYVDVFPKDMMIKSGEGMIGKAASTREIQLSNDVTQNPHYVRKVGEVTCSELSVPIQLDNVVIGVLDIQSDEKEAFQKTDVAMLETFSTQIAAAINNAKMYETSQNEIAERHRAETALRKSRDKLTNAKKETDNILKNVEEGLFLLDRKGEIGSQYSKSLELILNETNIANKSILDLLADKIPEKVLESTREYIELMFRDDIDEEMIGELNPLAEVMLSFVNEHGHTIASKNLSFKFKRITDYSDKIYKLISTVSDITEQTKMTRQLQEIEAQQKKQMEWMISILHVETPLLIEFLNGVKKEIEFIGTMLKKDHAVSEYQQVLEEIYRSIHTVKGNAGLLDLKLFLKLAHDFEEEISKLQQAEKVSGRDFVGLVLKLEDVKSALKEIEELFDRISNLQTHIRPKRSFEGEIFVNSLDNMISNLSAEQGKEVEFVHDHFNPNHIPFRFRLAGKEILVQLVRNSIIHGIEPPEERIDLHKSQKGKIILSSYVEQNRFGIIYEDDGRGLDIEKIRQRAMSMAKWDPDEINSLTDQQAAALIFEPGISTVQEANLTAGRGVGMDLVKHKIEDAGGTISIEFKEGQYFKFTFVLPANRK